MSRKKPYEGEFHGKRCVARRTRTEIEVDVYFPGSTEPDGEWAFPVAFGYADACAQAAIQTTKKREPTPPSAA